MTYQVTYRLTNGTDSDSYGVRDVEGVEVIRAEGEVLFLYGAEKMAGGARKVLFATGAHNLIELTPVEEAAS